MTVLLVGVGADTEHLRPALQLTPDEHFDYIPIPESYPTSEETTYGIWELEHRGEFASEFVEAIRPRGEGDEWIDDAAEIKSHPVHHDPNFDAMTFGDRRGGGGKGATLIKHLSDVDEPCLLGFYTGIRGGPSDPNLHRYLYGYMSVEEVHDLSNLQGGEYHNALGKFPENAHAKRLEAAEEPKHEDLVIVDGKPPSVKLEAPIKISERLDEPPWYRVSKDFAEEFSVKGGQKGIGRKFPMVLDIDYEVFLEKVESQQF